MKRTLGDDLELNPTDFSEYVPRDVLLKIMFESGLSPKDIISLSNVNKKFSDFLKIKTKRLFTKLSSEESNLIFDKMDAAILLNKLKSLPNMIFYKGSKDNVIQLSYSEKRFTVLYIAKNGFKPNLNRYGINFTKSMFDEKKMILLNPINNFYATKFMYNLIMDDWRTLLELCVGCNQVANYQCSETKLPFCGEKCWKRNQ